MKIIYISDEENNNVSYSLAEQIINLCNGKTQKQIEMTVNKVLCYIKDSIQICKRQLQMQIFGK